MSTDKKTTRTIIAAGEIFLRYGYARTTMGDIAKAAGMSRPALYLLFPGKEQIFAAATKLMAKQRLEEVRVAIEPFQEVEQKLATACEMLLVGIYDLQQTNPDARDMDDLAFPVVREIYTMFLDFFAEIIAHANVAYPASPERIATVMLYGARGLRNVAISADEYRELIRLQIGLLCKSGLH